LKREGKKFPDLIMVDGGKGQLSSAVKALKDLKIFPYPVIALAKKQEEVFIPESKDPQNIPKTSSANRLLQQLRDESHRFAITFHRKKRGKRALRSILDDIPGIGEKRRIQLLNYFGSVQKMRSASLEELGKVPYLPKNLVKEIFDFLKKN
jgi:excinuclease ABC subunit C